MRIIIGVWLRDSNAVNYWAVAALSATMANLPECPPRATANMDSLNLYLFSPSYLSPLALPFPILPYRYISSFKLACYGGLRSSVDAVLRREGSIKGQSVGVGLDNGGRCARPGDR